MNRCRFVAWAAILALPGWALGQPTPFAPPSGAGATLLPPTAAPPEGYYVPQPAPYPYPAQPAPFVAPPTPAAIRALDQGWLFGADIAIIRPHFRGNIEGGPLDTTVSPALMLGYQFPSTRALLFEYRYFGASGDSTFLFMGDPAPTSIHRHTEGHVLDFDIRFREDPTPLLRTQWQIGIRAADISVYGSRPSTNFPSLVSNRFEGIGPHLDGKLGLAVFDTGFEFFGLGDIGVLYGSNHGFSQVRNPPFTGPLVDIRNDTHNAWTWNFRWQAGLSYWFNLGTSRITLSAGYEWDAFDFLGAGERVLHGGGAFGLIPVSYTPGDVRLVNTGPFVRFEWRY